MLIMVAYLGWIGLMKSTLPLALPTKLLKFGILNLNKSLLLRRDLRKI